MTRDDLAEMIGVDAGITTGQAAKALQSFQRHVAAALAAGEQVQLFGFGRFEAHIRKATTGRHPQTGAPLEIGPTARARFHQSAELGRRLAPLAGRIAATAEAA